MEKTDSHRLITTINLTVTANAVHQLLSVKGYVVNVEPLFSIYDIFPHVLTNNTTPYPEFVAYPAYDKPYDPDEIALILHPSGSTGLPKPIRKCGR